MLGPRYIQPEIWKGVIIPQITENMCTLLFFVEGQYKRAKTLKMI